jgi:hypothetical protein
MDALPGAQLGRRIVLPPSFIGGPRQTHKLYTDAMAAVRKFGCPDLFISITKPEVARHQEQSAAD